MGEIIEQKSVIRGRKSELEAIGKPIAMINLTLDLCYNYALTQNTQWDENLAEFRLKG